MPRVKRGTKRRAKRKKILKRASGYFLTKSKLYRSAKEAVERGLKFAYSGRKQKKRQYRSHLDRAHRRRRPPERVELQPVHQRIEEGRRGTGSQDSGRPGGQRSGGIWASGRAGEEGARSGVESAVGSQPFTFCACHPERSRTIRKANRLRSRRTPTPITHSHSGRGPSTTHQFRVAKTDAALGMTIPVECCFDQCLTPSPN